ncbi:Actin/actin-like protein [Microthyrium microscopicum]|uniref:Actin/actin-like protein n=1 Tax=Microthyrium microscopicum TaxID=703497 RepID=A0A6A6TZJ2_9PEZI|nr:Actin/actin-like protein [Microthyrium microscopicum]
MATPNQFTQPQSTDYGGDEVSALVLDPGFATTRAGFAGEDVPKSIVPTYYGVKNPPGAAAPKLLFGENAMHDPQPYIDVRNPLAGGGAEEWVSDWDAAGKLWEYAITSRLTGERKRTIRTGSTTQGGAEDEEDTEMKDGENGANGDDADDEENPMAFHPLLMSEPGKTTSSSRQKAIELVMEGWDIPAFYMAKTGQLAAFSVGKTTALVVDVGASMVSITPLMDGMILKKGVKTSPLGGNFISNQIRQMFASQPSPVPLVPYYMIESKTPVDAGQPSQAVYKKFAVSPTDSFRAWEEERVLKGFKESVVQVYEHGRLSAPAAQGMTNEEAAKSSDPGKTYEMPDGWNQLFGTERYKVSEGLFDAAGAYSNDENPAPKPEQTIAKLVEASLLACDQEVRPALLNNIVIVGGSSLMQGFVRRFDIEIKALFPGPNVRLSAPSNPVERKFASWIGGSILSSLGSFHQLWISRKEYDEHGPIIVEKRSK